MSHFYGVLVGARETQTTRTGNKRGGLRATAASWGGAIQVQVWHDPDTSTDHFEVRQIPWQGVGTQEHLASGVIGQNAKEVSE